MVRRLGAREQHLLSEREYLLHMLTVQSNIATTLHELGRLEEAVRMLKEVYASRVRLFGQDEDTLNVALNLSVALVRADEASESMAFSRPLLSAARRAFGTDHDIYLRLAHSYAWAVMECAAASREELIFAEKLLEDTARRFRRVFGTAHPSTARAEGDLAALRRRIANL